MSDFEKIFAAGVLLVTTVVLAVIFRSLLWSAVTSIPKGIWRLVTILRGEGLKKKLGKGIFLNLVDTNVKLRLAVGAPLGLLAGAGIFQTTQILRPDLAARMGTSGLLALCTLFLLLALANNKPAVIPGNYIGILSWLTLRLPIYLEEGTHYWYATWLGFSISTEPLLNTKDPKEEKGFVRITEQPKKLWNGMEDKSTDVVNHASDASEVIFNIIFTLLVQIPLTWAKSTDPLLDVAERLRAALQKVTKFFVGLDCIAMQPIFARLLLGDILLTAYTSRPHEAFPRGSVIQQPSGRRIYMVLPGDTSPGNVEQVRDALWEVIQDEADSGMLSAIDTSKGCPVEVKFIKDDVTSVAQKVGALLTRISVSRVKLSKEVTDAANLFAAETQQRLGQLASAETMVEAFRTLVAGGVPEDYAASIVGAKDVDGSILINIPGGDALAKAAAILAQRGGS